MIPTAYESVPHQVAALVWPEATQADLEALIGAENVNVTPSFTQVRNSAGDWVTLGTGWAVAVDATGYRCVISRAALARRYREKADGS
jgi:hypothetical protein